MVEDSNRRLAGPDYRALVERHAPALEIKSLVTVEQGWDSVVVEVNDDWIFRIPRRAQVAESLQLEVALLPELGPRLPIPVPRFEIVGGDDPVELVGYRKLHGSPLDVALAEGADPSALARQVGAFLAALHGFDVARAEQLGLPATDGPAWLARYGEFREWAEQRAVPLLARPERRRASLLFEDFFSRARSGFAIAVVHADLGPEHALCRRDGVSGVIDWGDVRIGDPALDFAWLLHGVANPFGDLLLAGYREAGGIADPELRARALFYHRLAPWYHVHYGLEFDHPEFVDSGLAAVRSRLPAPE